MLLFFWVKICPIFGVKVYPKLFQVNECQNINFASLLTPIVITALLAE
jgi:hypothetical protein